MLNSYYTEKVIGFQGVVIKNFLRKENDIEIEIEQERKKCICPRCGEQTNKIADDLFPKAIAKFFNCLVQRFCFRYSDRIREHIQLTRRVQRREIDCTDCQRTNWVSPIIAACKQGEGLFRYAGRTLRGNGEPTLPLLCK